jgi:nitroreductase
MSDLAKVIENRHSIRSYDSTDVPFQTIEKIIKLASLAPSAGALQSYKVIITKEKIVNINSPIQLVICADLKTNRYGKRGRFYAIQDATILASYIQLIACDMGLSTVWVGAFREKSVKEKFNLGENLQPIAVIPLGYSDFKKTRGRRKDLKEIICSRS